MTHEQIASTLGAHRTTVTRALARRRQERELGALRGRVPARVADARGLGWEWSVATGARRAWAAVSAEGLLGERRAFLGAIRCDDCRCRRPRRGNAVGARGAVGR